MISHRPSCFYAAEGGRRSVTDSGYGPTVPPTIAVPSPGVDLPETDQVRHRVFAASEGQRGGRGGVPY